MPIIDGKAIAASLRKEIALRLQNHTIKPHLVVVQIGDNQASTTYVKNKYNACKEVGMRCSILPCSDSITQDQLLKLIKNLNESSDVNGIIVQMPLPAHIDEDAVMLAIDPNKDADGFHPINVGKMVTNMPGTYPIAATPLGIVNLLMQTDVNVAGKKVCVVGRSNIVGKPIAALLTNMSATVTICHSQTKRKDLQRALYEADIVILAVGKAKMFNGKDIMPNTVVIDVGINRDENGKLCGDFDPSGIEPWMNISYTPVPGGVGPMTIVSLLENVMTLTYGTKGE